MSGNGKEQYLEAFMGTLKSIIGKMLPRNLKQWRSIQYRSIKYRRIINNTYSHYNDVEKIISKRGDTPLRVASYVVFDATFGASDLFDLMLADTKKYSSKIVVIPDISRGKKHQIEQYNKTKNFFKGKYGEDCVIDGWNQETDEYYDLSNQFDIVYLANPYDAMVHEYHGVEFLSQKNVLPIYISYGCMPDNNGCKMIMPHLEISLFWKVFADNEMSYNDYKKYELAKGKNVVLSGYAKMDSLVKFTAKKSERKRIIIAPHHTVNYPEFPLSNFVEYADYFLNLPELFPQVDFIFRPHPLLFTNMVNAGLWTERQVEDYIAGVQKAGMLYSTGGDYLDIFVNSDAMIHDCSSFVVEYLYTGKPCCFMAKKNYKKIFATLGKSCLKNYYMAFNTQQITNFIQDVIIDGNDSLKNKRENYAKEHLALNYPNVSEKILKEITI